MRQVPQYLIIGNGRVARHFQHYFHLMHVPFLTWHRQQSLTQLQKSIPQATHILILIKDQAIDLFISDHFKKANAILMHFSGSMVSTLAIGAHPLMSFGEKVYSLEQYQSIPFILDHDAPDWLDLFPMLMNSHVRLDKSLKLKYHALCVLSGNFSCMLWQKLFSSLEQEFHLPPSIAHAYLKQQTINLLEDSKSALTGPLVREDKITIEKNLAALANDPFQEIYKSFVECYNQLKKENKE